MFRSAMGIVAVFCVCQFNIVLAAPADGTREWTLPGSKAASPRKVMAFLQEIVDGKVVLVDSKGKTIRVALSKLPDKERKDALMEAVGSGVVAVKVKDVFDKDAGLGSGFVIKSKGLILTNYHVVRGAASVDVQFRDSEELVHADCLGVDRLHDVAVLKVAELPKNVRVLAGAKEPPQAGDSVWTIGHPQGLVNTVSWGDVNAVRRTAQLPKELRQFLNSPEDTTWIQTDAVIARGSSGGPLLNSNGQVIGLNTFISGPQLGFAVAVEHVSDVCKKARSAAPLDLPIPPGEGEPSMKWYSREVGRVLKPYAEEMESLQATARGANAEAVRGKLTEIYGKYRIRMLEIAKQAPESWPSLQAMMYTILLSDDSPDSQTAAAIVCDLLLKHHVDCPDLAVILEKLEPAPVSLPFARKVLEASPHDRVRAAAAGKIALEQMRCMESGDLTLSALETSRKEAEQMIAKLKTEFGESKFGDNYTGLQAAEELLKSLGQLVIGNVARDISGIDNDGKTFRLAEYRGKVVLLDFFADWCPHCKKMYGLERKLTADYAQRPFAILGVHCENQSILNRLSKDNVVTWRCFADGEGGPIAQNWEIGGYPTIYLIDKNGVVRRQVASSVTEAELRDWIDKLATE